MRRITLTTLGWNDIGVSKGEKMRSRKKNIRETQNNKV